MNKPTVLFLIVFGSISVSAASETPALRGDAPESPVSTAQPPVPPPPPSFDAAVPAAAHPGYMAHLASAVRSAAALPEYQKLEAEVPTCPSPQLETLRARMELLALEKSPVPADLKALVERRRSELQARLSPRPNPTPKNPAN